jgi:hypothetical protein
MKLKKLLTILAVSTFFFMLSQKQVHAATLYWVGADGANASVASNWSTTNPTGCAAGVTPSGGAPSSADTINFDADCDNSAVIDASFSSTVAVLNLNSGYTGTVTLSNPLTVTTSYSQVTGTFTAGSQTFDIDGTYSLTGGIFTASSTNMYVGSTFTITGSPTFNHNNGTITFDTTIATLTCGNVLFNLVVINAPTASDTKTVAPTCTLPLGANPTISRVTLRGILSGTGTLHDTGQLNFDASGNASTALVGFSGLIVDSTFTLANSSAHVNLGSYTTVDLNGQFTFSAGTFTAPSGTMTVGASMTISGTPTFNANGGTITFDGTVGGVLSCNNVTFNFVTFNHLSTTSKTVSSNCTLPVGNNPTFPGVMNISGTLVGTGTLTFARNSILNAGATLSGFTGLIEQNTMTYSGATIDFSIYSPFIIQNQFILSSGTFTAPAVMSVSTNFAHTGGTFNHNNGTVILDGTADQIISGSTTFYNLIKSDSASDVLKFTDGTTQTILGNLTLKGAKGSLLSLRSTTGGAQWGIDAQGSRDLQYLDVQDGNNINGNLMSATNSVDSGNNTGWLFPIAGLVFNLVSPSDRSYIHDQRPTFSWRPPATQSLFDAAKDYTLTIDNGMGSDFVIEGIPATPPDNVKTYETATYIVQYLNWDDAVLSNRMISVQTKGSDQWIHDHHNGQLTEGRRTWRVKLTDKSNSTSEMSNEIYVDFTGPSTLINQIGAKKYTKGTIPLNKNTILYGRAHDALSGSSDDRKVASGPKEFTVTFKKKIWGPLSLPVFTETVPVQRNYWETTRSLIEDNTKNDSSKFSTFSYKLSKKLPKGIYQMELVAKDNADNSTYQPTTYTVQIK